MEEEQMLTKEQILDMLDAGQYKELKEELGNMYPVDIAETLEDFEQKPLVMVFRLLAKEEAAETFTYMNSDMREVLIGALTDPSWKRSWKRCIWTIRSMSWKRCLRMLWIVF